MRALKVQVYDSETKRTRTERYARSPVHIGRHPSNELCLSFGFVSSRHAQLEFDERGGTFKDLGSTNGSVIGGRRVNAHETHPIGDGLNVTIGKLEMRFAWDEVGDQAGPPNLIAGRVEGRPEGAPMRTKSPRLPTQPIQAVSDIAPASNYETYQPATVQHALENSGMEPPRLDSGVGQGPPRLRADTGGSGVGPPPGPMGPPPLLEPPRMDSGVGSLGPPPMLEPPPMMASSLPTPEPGLPDTEPPRRPGAEATGFVDLSGVHRAIRELKPAYDELQAARERFQAAMDASLDKLPRTTRETAQAFLRREFPEMPGATPSFAAPTPTGGGGEANILVTNFAAMLLSSVEPPGTQDEAAAFLARIAEILQTTAQAFVEVRNVQARFGEEMGVRTIREYTPLHGAGDARAVIDYLLDWRRGGPERNAQLSAVYSDFMLHQVALINGVVEGVQAMMDQFRPAEIERGVSGLNKSAAAWKKFMERYAEVIEDRGIAALVFGPEFARAYAEVGGS